MAGDGNVNPNAWEWDWERPELREQLRVGTVLETYDFGYIRVNEITLEGVIAKSITSTRSLWPWVSLKRLECRIYRQSSASAGDKGADDLSPLLLEHGAIMRQSDGATDEGEAINQQVAEELRRLMPSAGPSISLMARRRPTAPGPMRLAVTVPGMDKGAIKASESLHVAVERLYDFRSQWTAWAGLTFVVENHQRDGWRYDIKFRYR